MIRYSLARPTATVELQLMFHVGKTAFSGDLLFEVLDRARDFENFHRTAVATDQKVLMGTLAQTVVRCPAVKSDSTHDALFLQTHHEPIEGRWIAGYSESGTRRNLLQSDRLICFY